MKMSATFSFGPLSKNMSPLRRYTVNKICLAKTLEGVFWLGDIIGRSYKSDVHLAPNYVDLKCWNHSFQGCAP
jgi:hypothetical protein